MRGIVSNSGLGKAGGGLRWDQGWLVGTHLGPGEVRLKTLDLILRVMGGFFSKGNGGKR